MDEKIKQNLKEHSTWMRGLYMLFFILCAGLAKFIIAVIVIFQFLLVLFTLRTNERLLEFGQSLGVYIYQILQFLTFNSNEHPYPLGAWPEGKPIGSEITQSIHDDRSSDEK
jgi:hypothetical protein